MFFFFSSRRRHTRYWRDWSSDVCSSDLDTPTAFILSRQGVDKLPENNPYSNATKGAYIVAGSDENPDVILVASGSEVSTLVAGAQALRNDGVKVRIVSCPSEGLFRQQSIEYQEAVRS